LEKDEIYQKIIKSIFNAIDEVNFQLDEGIELEKSTQTLLFGRSGVLDSNGLVILIVTIEEKIEDEFGVSLTIADEKALSQEKSPFISVETLADYIALLLLENKA
jgi:hypothetical protein